MKKPETSPATIFQGVADYCAENFDFSFDSENPIVRLHEPSFGAEEINAALECMLSTHVTMGPKVKAFEREFADDGAYAHGVMVNSGSSANLLVVATLANPETKNGLKRGDEVIVPALSWSTTVWPLIQSGLTPVIVDIDPKTLNIDPNEIERAISPKTRAVMIVPVYGNPCDMDAITDICHRHNLILIEDCCEALGATYDGKALGKFGIAGTFSFYYSHHMTTLEGGICVSDDTTFAENMRILRAHGWLREVEDRSPWEHLNASDLDPRFLFVNVGYNLRATELQGAMGSVQLPKLEGFVKTRRRNAQWFFNTFKKHSNIFDFQHETPKGRHSWFGFPIILKPEAPFKVAEIRNYLESVNIETRPIICGNIARQPAMKLYEHRTVGTLDCSTHIMHNGFSFGCHQAIDDQARDYVATHINAFLMSKNLV